MFKSGNENIIANTLLGSPFAGTYTLTRSRRKTVVIYVRGGAVEVRAPLRMPEDEIDRFVAEKEEWILKILAKQRIQVENKKSFAVNYGSFVTFRGNQYAIASRSGLGFDGEFFCVPPDLTPQQIKAICIQIYRRLAKEHISNRVAAFAAQMNAVPAVVKINGAMKRWGSCSSKKSLNFSWRLIMADDSVIDYVVVHELAHLVEMNHSARFWAVVATVLPDYPARKLRLKELQKKLANEDWALQVFSARV
ncbi:MAG: M48 family metallopeptidase [Defluviitaleaceae bacterium]|nr:M48 family metallopeptidase [Defluviitaleaceae bacterium]